MNSKRLFLTLSALAALLLVGTNCTLVYQGCEKNSDCDEANGEICIKSSGAGECGLPSTFCEEGSMIGCEPQAYDPAEVMMLEDPEDRASLTPRGECADKMQVCDAMGQWIACIEEEGCDGLDNDCNGLVDDGIEGVGDACSAGDGVCRRTGNQVCEADGSLSCNAVAGAPEAPACDCFDNNCDQIINDFDLSTDAAEVAPPAVAAPWTMALLGGARYAAVENAAGGIDVVNLDSDTGTALLATLPVGTSPKLFASELNQTLVVFYVRNAPNELMVDQAEVHVASVLAATGELLGDSCIGCGDALRGSKGGVTDFDVDFSGTDADEDGLLDPSDVACDNPELMVPCGYVAVYIRAAEGVLHSVRVGAVNREIVANSEGIVLNFNDNNSDLRGVKIEVASATLSFLGLVRETSPGTHDVLLASALSQGRVQVNRISAAIAGFDPASQDFDLAVLPEGDEVLIASTTTSPAPGLELRRFGVSDTSASFRPIYDAPAVIEPAEPTEGDALSHVELAYLCQRDRGTPGQSSQPEYAMLAYEVTDSEGSHTIEALIVDRGNGLPAFRAPTATPGTWPRLERIDGEFVLGALVDADQSGVVADATPLTPSIDALTCDP